MYWLTNFILIRKEEIRKERRKVGKTEGRKEEGKKHNDFWGPPFCKIVSGHFNLPIRSVDEL